MTQLVTIDYVGSFATPDRTIEAIRWTHRDRNDGWSVTDFRPGATEHYYHVGTKAEAKSLVRRLLRSPAR